MNLQRARLAAVVAILVLVHSAVSLAQEATPQELPANQIEARKALNAGVSAYRKGDVDRAIHEFQTAKSLDSTLHNAQLYLATAYSAQYAPGDPSENNVRMGEAALAEYKDLLEKAPSNLSALDGAASILYNLAYAPYRPDLMEQSKSYHRKHIELAPSDAEPYYWIGVIDWSVAYRANKVLRDSWAAATSKAMPIDQPLPEDIRREFVAKYAEMIEEGIRSLSRAIELQPNYDDAMAYLNLLYRQKADTESDSNSRERDLAAAEDLVAQVKAIKEKKLQEAERRQ